MSFLLGFLGTGECDTPSSGDKGVELAVGNWKGEGYWIPVAYYFESLSRRPEINIGTLTSNSARIRGYTVATTMVDGSINASLEICDPTILEHSHIQFRWLETTRHSKQKPTPLDVWLLDDITIEYITGSVTRTLLRETFESQILK